MLANLRTSTANRSMLAPTLRGYRFGWDAGKPLLHETAKLCLGCFQRCGIHLRRLLHHGWIDAMLVSGQQNSIRAEQQCPACQRPVVQR